MSLLQSTTPPKQPAAKPLEQRLHERISIRFNALATFEGEPQTQVTIENISESGVGILSPVLGLPKSSCWVKFLLPIEGEEDQIFNLYAEVIHGYYSPKNKLFKVGIRFFKTQPELMQLVKNLNV